jgi:hypothetical protein
MRVHGTGWLSIVGLILLIGAVGASAPALALSHKVHVSAQGLNHDTVNIWVYQGLNGTTDKGCTNLEATGGLGTGATVQVTGQLCAGGRSWCTDTSSSFVLDPARGPQGVFLSCTYPRSVWVTVIKDNSCDGQETWVITFTEGGCYQP